MEELHFDPHAPGYDDTHGDHHESGAVILPTPTPHPFALSLGIALVISGMVTHWAISVLGGLITIYSAVGWFFQVLPHEQHIAVPVSVELLHITSPRVNRKQLPALEGHHQVHPIQTFSIAAGIRGGLAGAIAMVIPAIIFGLIAYHSIWYPVNLLAAGGFVNWPTESTAFLTQFHIEGLLAAMGIHLLASILIGMLYSAMLPIYPRHPILTAGFIAPLLWTGLLYTALGIISPVLNERISWRWFVPSQIAFGLVCGFVVNLSIRVRSEQFRNLPFSVRAGIHSDRPEDEPKKDDYV